MDLKTLITDYLSQAKLMQVVTANNNQPWACTVYFAFDEKFNLYWISKTSARHSTELRNNENVAGTVVLPHIPGDKVRGVQFQGVATELNDKNAAKIGMMFYAERFGVDEERVNAIVENSDGHVCYKIKPSLFVLFDEVNFPENPRQEFHPD